MFCLYRLCNSIDIFSLIIMQTVSSIVDQINYDRSSVDFCSSVCVSVVKQVSFSSSSLNKIQKHKSLFAELFHVIALTTNVCNSLLQAQKLKSNSTVDGVFCVVSLFSLLSNSNQTYVP